MGYLFRGQTTPPVCPPRVRACVAVRPPTRLQRMDMEKTDSSLRGVEPKEEDGQITTKLEYSRWCTTQNNFASAEEVRAQRRIAAEEKQRRKEAHKERGLLLQQDATLQMKRATESVDDYRKSNIELGRSVKEEESNWRRLTGEWQ